MLLYRVVPFAKDAVPYAPGHPTYRPKSTGLSRLDNPNDYDTWYFSMEESGAIGESFGNLSIWSDAMFEIPQFPDRRRCLATYVFDDSTPILDLDDAKELLRRGLKPSEVVQKIRPATQDWARDIFIERNDFGQRKWAGVRFWSYHCPDWRIVGYWDEAEPKDYSVEPLSCQHHAVKDAARTLGKEITN